MGATIQIAVLANAAQAKRELNDTATTASRVGDGFKKMALPAAAVLGVIGKVGGDALKAVANVERINAQTTNVIKSTGGAANVTQGHVENLANKLEKVTATEAELVQEGANVLLTFTNIRNEAGKGNAVFDRSVVAVTDYSRALGVDMASASIQVGKALNDPIKGIGALSKAGVQFTEDQKKLITSMVETGDTMGAQKIILSELEKQFGGSGAAFAKTATGQFEILKNEFGAMTENLVAGLLPTLTDLATKGSKAFAWAAEHQGATQAIVLTIAGLAAGVLAVNAAMAVGGAAVAVYTGALAASAAAQGAFAALSLGTRIGLAALAVQSGITAVAQGVLTAAQWALNAAMLANPIGLVVLAIVALVAIFVVAWKNSETFRNIVIGAWNAIKSASVAVFNFLKSLISGAFEFLKNVFLNFTGPGLIIKHWESIKAATTAAFDFVKNAVKRGIDAALEFIRGMKERVSNVFSGAGEWLYNAGKKILQGLIDGIQAMIGRVRSKLNEITNLIPDWKGPAPKDARLLRPAGQLIIGGLIDGFDDEKPKVQKYLGALSKDIATFGSGASADIKLDASAAYSSSVSRRSSVEITLTAEQTSQLQRGRAIKADLTAYESVGIR